MVVEYEMLHNLYQIVVVVDYELKHFYCYQKSIPNICMLGPGKFVFIVRYKCVVILTIIFSKNYIFVDIEKDNGYFCPHENNISPITLYIGCEWPIMI